MTPAFYAMDYDELKARYDALEASICDDGITASHLICDPRIPILRDMNDALSIISAAREKLGRKA